MNKGGSGQQQQVRGTQPTTPSGGNYQKISESKLKQDNQNQNLKHRRSSSKTIQTISQKRLKNEKAISTKQ